MLVARLIPWKRAPAAARSDRSRVRRTHGVSSASSSSPQGASSRGAGTSGTGRYARLSASGCASPGVASADSGSAPALWRLVLVLARRSVERNGSDEWPRRFTYSCRFDLSFSAGADSTDENRGLQHNRADLHRIALVLRASRSPTIYRMCLLCVYLFRTRVT